MEVGPVQRAARLHGPRDLRVEEVPVPSPAPGEVLVRVRRVGICGSDVHFYETGSIGPTRVIEPLVLGHESSGVIMEVGEGVDAGRLGERVAVEPGVPCGSCDECARGSYNLCEDIAFFAFPPTDGALREFIAIDSTFAHAVPDGVSDDASALIEPLAVVLQALTRVEVRQGTTVNVSGAGPIGLLATRVLCLRGASVTVSDPRPASRALALEYGADVTIDPRAEGLPRADYFVDCSGSPQAIWAGVESLRPRGTAVLVGVGPHGVELPLTSIRRRELTVTSSFRYAHMYPEAIALAQARSVDLDSLVTHRYDLDSAEQAFLDALEPADGRQAIKSVITLGDTAG